ncbi:helix-turn-helix domain-containing protein [Vibrio sp. 03-59-1]|uniref:helix-turn-helix domain-containing protein n=1 Tax=Vibrio sp. 03-59-1 TaxID=2607607 RepID=UPI00149350BA|nr:helix-turn-helix domain-containing protein [Vibrio sp. 03-59-1]NOH84678.1 helix-turn-helix domain-containing protein [Vibrio sp. 03-59-1]
MKEILQTSNDKHSSNAQTQNVAIESVINLINPYDAKREFQVFVDGKRTQKLQFSHQKKAIDLGRILRANSGEKLLEIPFFKNYVTSKEVILLPSTPLSKSYPEIDRLKPRDVKHDSIIDTFWPKHTKQKFEKTEALILITTFLAEHADKNSMGFSASLGELAVYLGMSIRRVSNNIKLLEEEGYICFHTKVTKRGHTGLQSFVELTKEFWLNFTSVFEDVHEYQKHIHQTLTSTNSPYIVKSPTEHFQFRTNLHHLKQNLVELVRRQDCPRDVRVAVFRVLG